MGRLDPPDSGVTVRMYRQGHGDCFLLCARGDDGDPFHLLIDCGIWSGSECDGGPDLAEVVDDIAEATGRRLDVLVITHEHKDHVSGFLLPAWAGFEIGELWLAWTEDERDEDANELRRRFDDVLLGLAAAAARPGKFGLDEDGRAAALIRDVIELHTGGADVDALAALGLAGGEALAAVPGLSNKRAILAMREKARRIRFLAPERGPVALPRAKEVRAFTLGPPRDPALLLSLDPKGEEGFGLDGAARMFLAALGEQGEAGRPFSRRHGVAPARLRGRDRAFFREHYGAAASHPEAWRRIGGDWAEVAESLALRLHSEVNNTSLVLAFELPRTRKVLLFTGDAQRGSWISWAPLAWADGAGQVTARDLLGRVALYKVGHHGSHNATLKGRAGDAHPNLGWLGLDEAGEEFVAFIPANRPWAYGKKKWRHPLEDIEKALASKAAGRVFRLDREAPPPRPPTASEAKWTQFLARANVGRLFAEYTVAD